MASIPPPTSPLAQPGATIALKYRLDSLVGYGGMGSVWVATHLGLGHQVAIKLISQDHVRSIDVRRRFDTEAKAVARLKSRHVVQIYDNGELEDGTPYIAMELLHGESLHRRIHRAGPMPLAEAVTVIGQVCRALARAHAAGIVHRDIKPDNIFLANSEEDGGYVTKVLDFGVAKLSLKEGETSATQTGSLVGTPLYMSPEQARGLKSIDHRTDLYSLALVSYTMLTGNLAFSGDSFGDLLLKICTQELPSLQQSAPWLPPTVDAWFRKAGAREPADRYQSAQEFADALAAAAGVAISHPNAAVGVSQADQSAGYPAAAGKFGDSGAKPLPETRPVGAGSHGGGTMTGATVQAATGHGEAQALPKSRAPMAVAAAVAAIVILGGAGFLVLGRHAAPPPASAGSPAVETGHPVAVAVPEAPREPVAPPPSAPAASVTAIPTAPAEPPAKSHEVAHTPAASQAPAAAHPAAAQKPAAGKPTKPSSGAVDLGY